MDWSIYAIPIATVLGALIGGLVSLRINATQAQRGVVDEFSKLSAAQAAQMDNLHSELGHLRERTALLENEVSSWEQKSVKWETRYRRARNYIDKVILWEHGGRIGDFPPVPEDV